MTSDKAPSHGGDEAAGMTKALILLRGALSRRFDPSKEYGTDFDRKRLAACNRITVLLPQVIALIERQSAELLRLRKSFAPPGEVEASGEVGEGG